MNKIVLDANVLYSNILRGLFLWLSWNGLFQVVWSDEIWDEVFRNYSDDEEIKKRFRQTIHEGVFEEFSSSRKVLAGHLQAIGLPDKEDEHVVALARQENCSTIITLNLKDFPQALLAQVGVSVCSPDLFLCDLLASEPDDVKEGVHLHIKAQTRMKPKKELYLEKLKTAKVANFAARLETEDRAGNQFLEVWT
ncbi:MAG: PIN domain-containing protein [Bdellovibrionaceae bacterium]|nr:PIN domain-containing protein [Pseudobdellovibrionaceae bacterium]